jgi:LysR family hydrogen peroxide-inducible transcriptional activator
VPSIRDVDLSRLMLLGEGHCLREHSLSACVTTRKGKPVPPSDIEATSLTTMVQMVEAGLGVSMLPNMAIKAGLLNVSDVVAKPFAPPSPSRTVALVTRPTQVDNPFITQVLVLAKKFGQSAVGRAERSNNSVKKPS